MSRDTLTLQECNRQDLIWIIKRILQMVTLTNGSYYLNRALSDLRYEKEKKSIDEAEKVCKLADAKLAEYIELMKQYDGMPLCDIPLEVLTKGQELLKEHSRLERKWCRMMDIGGKK